jgi:tetratricopeptide (TPR) repeat protein
MHHKPWNPIGIGLIAFFFTFLPAGIMLGENYERLGKKQLKWPVIIATILMYSVFLWAVIFIPDGYNWLFQVIHVSSSIGIALLQRPLFEKVRDEQDEDFKSASFLFPGLYSAAYIIVFFGGLISYQWYSHSESEKLLSEAQNAYLQGDFAVSIDLLKSLIEKEPNENIYVVNLAMTYEAAGKLDSAVVVLRDWLIVNPNDTIVKEKLYELRYGKE